MELTCKEIWELYVFGLCGKIYIKRIRKIRFKIVVCEKYTDYTQKNIYTFYELDWFNNNIYLKNHSGKVIKILNKDNVAWLGKIVAYDKNIECEVCDYDGVRIKDVEV